MAITGKAIAGLALLCLGPVLAWGQADTVMLSVTSTDVGWNGTVRVGCWTPMLLSLQSQAPTHRRVQCQWLVTDVDGDTVVARRGVTLNPQRRQEVWLYAVPPVVTKTTGTTWRVQILDDASGQLLAAQDVLVTDMADPAEALMAITGSGGMGLQFYDHEFAINTQHEPYRFISGVSPQRLPDRWHGYEALDFLLWNADSLDPASPMIPLESLKALRQWVRRGGHLVISLPPLGQTWTTSALADLLPPVTLARKQGILPPTFLGIAAVPARIDILTLTPQSDHVAVLLRDGDGDPTVVAQSYGFGRVTLIGVDLAALSRRPLAAMKLPNGPVLWNTIFGWRSPAFSALIARQKIEASQMQSRLMISWVDVSRFVRALVAMRGTFTTPLLAAVLVFIAYWFLAGPVSYLVLRQQGATRYAWITFLLAVLLFSALCWGGAALLRPTRTQAEHYSVLDADAQTGELRVRSWLSLFVPEHGPVLVEVDPARTEGNTATLSAPGLPPATEESVFMDSQRYAIDAAAPHQAAFAFRSTAKQIELRWQGPADAEGHPWQVEGPLIKAVWEDSPQPPHWPVGKLTHGLPGTLADVLVVYCPGDGAEPWVWRLRDAWLPGRVLNLRGDPSRQVGAKPTPMVVAGRSEQEWGGYLWQLMGNKPLHRLAEEMQVNARIAPDEIRLASEMLSFFATLPPPSWWAQLSGFGEGATHYTRSLGRDLDLTPRLAERRLFLIGYLSDSVLPAPLAVDGRSVPTRGWTVVRWTSRLPQPSTVTAADRR